MCSKKLSFFGSVLKHDMTSFKFSICHLELNDAKLSSLVQFENEMLSRRALKLNKRQRPVFQLFQNIVTCRIGSHCSLIIQGLQNGR